MGRTDSATGTAAGADLSLMEAWRMRLGLNAQDFLLPMLLAMCYCAYFFVVNLCLFLPGGVSESEESLAFVSGWLLAPAASLACTYLVRTRPGQGPAKGYPFLVLANILALALCVVGWRFGVVSPYLIAGVIPAVNAAVLVFGRKVHVQPGTVLAMAPAAAFILALCCAGEEVASTTIAPAVLTAAALWFFAVYEGSFVSRMGKLPAWIPDAVVVILLALITVDVHYYFHPHHHDFYLGPVNDLMGGRSLLADINCQYGVGVIYALAAVFQFHLLPFSYQGFALLLSLLLALQYATVYRMLRAVAGGFALPVIAVGSVVLLNLFDQLTFVTWYPSIGPLRFGTAYALLACLLLAERYPLRRRLFGNLALVAVAVASVWSLESLVYTLAAWGAAVLYQTLSAGHSLRSALRTLGLAVGRLLLYCAAAHLLLAADVLRRSGSLPHWGYYLDYVRLYSAGQFGTLPIEPWTPWVVVIAALAASFIAVAFCTLYGRRPAYLAFTAGLTATGIAQFTYFLGRSHPNNVLHICIPAIMLIVYWLAVMNRHTQIFPSAMRRSATAALCLSVGVVAAYSWPNTAAKFPSTLLGTITRLRFDLFAEGIARPWHKEPSRQGVAQAVYLLKKYSPGRVRVPVFLDSNEVTEALILTEKNNLFPISNPTQDNLLPSARGRILAGNPAVKAGDMVYLTRDRRALNLVQTQALQLLENRFRFQPLEETPDGIVAARLLSPDSAGGGGLP